MNRSLRNAMKRGIHGVFRVGQRLGVDILPRHFYSSVPDLRALQRSTYWRKPMDMAGVAGADIEPQLAFARQCCTTPLQEKLKAMDLVTYAASENGEIGYGPVEAEFLYCFIGTIRPKRIVQVGAGFSTAVILKAAADVGHDISVTCVDPYPTDYLRRINAAGKITLIPEMAQTVNRSALCNLGEGDMLFVDSTHTVKAGSEVNRIILDVLPHLSRGAYVHFHDIYFPYDYQRSLMSESFFISESTLLHAFLACNSRFAIRCSLSMLHYAASAELQKLLPRYQPQANADGLHPPGAPGHFPSATYLQVIA